MENNPYAPPKAAVADVEPAYSARSPPFFPVSRTKLIVMSTLTLSLYQIFWFYKNWAHVREHGTYVSPLIRAIFSMFFCYALFRRVRNYRDDLPSGRLRAGLLALGWVVITIASNFTDRLTFQGNSVVWSGAMFLVALLVTYMSVLFLLPVQNAINAINRAELPDHDPNRRFTVWNALWMTLGGFITGVGLLETLLPEF